MNCGRMMAAGLALAMAGAVTAGPDADRIAATGVKAMYLDAPHLDFSTLSGFKAKSWKNYVKYWPTISADYVGADDPMQPVAPVRAERIAKAGIPVLCIYGGRDGTVPPEKNILRFAEAFEKAGGHLKLWRDNRRGHHPHGLEKDEQQVFVNFFACTGEMK